MTIQEAELLNRSFERLGESLLRNRMLKQQREERERSFGLDERRVSAAEKSATANEDMREALLQDRQAQAAIGKMRQQVDRITGLHRAGQISTAEANQRLATLREKITGSVELMLRESGLADITLQDVPRAPKGEFNTAATANARRLGELRDALVNAQAGGDAQAIARASQELEDFQALAQRGGAEEYETVTETYPAVEAKPGTPGTPEVPPKKRSFLGFDSLRADEPGQPAVPAVPGTPYRPARTVTRKIRRGEPVDAEAASETDAGTGPDAGAPRGGVNVPAVIAAANEAIRKGADPARVKQRLKEQYGIEVQ